MYEMQEKEFKKVLKEKASKLSINLSDNQLEKFYQYKNILLEWNKKINLTAITDDKEMIDKHFIDSITIYPYIKKNKRIIDIGTGAGFPGIPVQIINDDNHMTLFDSLQKRLNVLDDIIRKINLKNTQTLHGRAEETFKNEEFREKFDIAISRAVASLNILVEYMLPSVCVGGYCICMKSNEIQEEISIAKKAIELLGGKIDKIEEVQLPDTEIKRKIIIIKKVKNTPKKYPRKPGMPNKSPIV